MPPESTLAKAGRPSGTGGAPKKGMLIAFDARQRRYLEAIRETAEFGKPSYTALVRKGVELLIEQALAKPDMRRAIEGHLGEARRAAIHEVKKA